MKNFNIYIQEKFLINNADDLDVENKLDISKLKNYSKDDIDNIVNWVNNEMSYDIRPEVITNIRKNVEWSLPEAEIYLFYTSNYEIPNAFEVSYIRFFAGENKTISVDIYDKENTKYHRSSTYNKNIKNLDKCFEFIESKHDLIKKIIKNEKSK